MRVPIAKEGFPFILSFLLLGMVAWLAGFFLPAALLFFLTLFVLFFFRDPERETSSDERAIVSPADGKVIRIREIPSGKILECPCIQLSVFMSIFNVHVNRMPFSGKTLTKTHNPGKCLPAFRDKASQLNEQTSILLDTQGGPVQVTQIAGLVARRVVCGVQEGEFLPKGERFGLIKFGSRLDLYLPLENTQLIARVGDKVKAGESVLARFYSLAKKND